MSKRVIQTMVFGAMISWGSIAFGQMPPVNKNATKEAKALLEYIYGLDDKILSGQHSYNHEPKRYYD